MIRVDETTKNADGSPRLIFDWSDGSELLGALLITGPTAGTIELSDGSLYDITDFVITCKVEHLGPLLHHIGIREHQMMDNIPEHICTDDCGFEKIDSVQLNSVTEPAEG